MVPYQQQQHCLSTDKLRHREQFYKYLIHCIVPPTPGLQIIAISLFRGIITEPMKIQNNVKTDTKIIISNKHI